MTRKIVVPACALVLLLALAPPLAAQDSKAYDWSHGTTWTGVVGAASAESADTRATLGGGFGWTLNRWVAVEASGQWLMPRHEDHGFSADITAVVNLARQGRVIPFVGGGMGLYIASFDTTTGTVPDFYQARIPENSAITHRTFTDPMFAFSAGMDIATRGRWSIRPVVDVKLVTDGSGAYPIAIGAVHIRYRFERHGAGG
jgi:hypothetical protein